MANPVLAHLIMLWLVVNSVSEVLVGVLVRKCGKCC